MDTNIEREQKLAKIEELRRAQLDAILKISGSEASLKNEKNTVIIPNKNDIASSLVFKTLKRDKLSEKTILESFRGAKTNGGDGANGGNGGNGVSSLNNEALKNTFGASFSELKPAVPDEDANKYVLFPLYEDQLRITQEQSDEIAMLQLDNEDLKAQIEALKTEVENANYAKLATEQTNDALGNQLDSTVETLGGFSEQVGTALQKSVEESIVRAALQAQNVGYKSQIEALIKQIDSLNSIIEGLQSQLGAVQQQQVIQAAASTLASSTGGTIVNDIVVASAKPQSNPPEAPIVGRINNLTYEYKWEYGQQLFITNNDLNAVSVTVEVFNPPGQNWLSSPINAFELSPGDSKDIDLIFNVGGASFTAGGYSSTHSGNVRVTVRRRDGSQASSNLEAKLNIMHPDVY